MFEKSLSYSLENFEGPLELLLYLIQKDEMDICSITLKKLTAQFLHHLEKQNEIDASSETLGIASTLLLIKSHKLIPSNETLDSDEFDRLKLIEQLLQYTHLREAAKRLSDREEEQKLFFPRPPLPFEKKQEPGVGLEEVRIEDLKKLLQEMILRSHKDPQKIVHQDAWQVGPKLAWLRTAVAGQSKLSFPLIFSEDKCRAEWIVLFLALLELMKLGELKVVREEENLYIIGGNHVA